MSQIARKQDLPPPNGYKPIPYIRMPAKQYFSGYAMFAGFAAITTGGFFLYYLNLQRVRREKVEARSARLAVYPALLAERDRAFLKQLSRNRLEEEKLMANVEGWKVGTWYGTPVYHTIPKDQFIEPTFLEFYAHASEEDFNKRVMVAIYS